MYRNMVFLTQAMAEGRLFALDGQTLISIVIQLFNAIILAVVLGFILYKPVVKFMSKRSEMISEKIENAEITMAKANELIAEYNAKIKEIDTERIQILETARLEATDESKIILQKAREEANEVKKRSIENFAADKKRLKEESRLYIIEVASLMANKYITQTLDNEAQNRIFEDTLSKLENIKWQI